MSVINRYRVAEMEFCVELPGDDTAGRLSNYAPFLIGDSADKPAFTLHFREHIPYEGMSGIPLGEDDRPDEPRTDVYVSNRDGSHLFEMYPSGRSPLGGRLLLSADCTDAWVDSTAAFAINNALMIAFALRGAREGVIEMHSSTVVHEGLAYMFLGVSGTGKSTHSRLWMENIPGTWLLNDDNPVIRVRDGRARVYGSPWSGKTACYKNDSAPIGGIVSLRQAKRNVMTRQSLLESYASVLSSCSGLKFDGAFMDTLHENIAQAVTSVPCWHLDCLPDDDAALLCCRTVEPAAMMAIHSIEIPNDVLLPEVEALLSEGKEVVLKTKGNSMLPTIKGGRDSVRLKKMDSYNKGDVVLARLSAGHYVLHRIKSVDQHEAVLKGDGNIRGVEHCIITDICGKAVGIVTDGKERHTGTAALWNRLPVTVRRIVLHFMAHI